MPHRFATADEPSLRGRGWIAQQWGAARLMADESDSDGAMAVIRHANRGGETTDPWLAGMLARKPRMLVAVALANRMARIAWAVTTHRQSYRPRAAA